jgi:hypothetical protein
MLKAMVDNTGSFADGGGSAGSGLDESDCHFPMWVLPIDKAIEVMSREGDLPCHEDLRAEGLMTTDFDPAKCLFFSHTWLRFKHPDSADGVKKKLIKEVLTGILEGTVQFNAYWFAVVAHQMADVSSKDVTARYTGGYIWLEYVAA